MARRKQPKQYTFSVTGENAFPEDMLRYDSCQIHPDDMELALGPPGLSRRDLRRHWRGRPRRTVRCIGERAPKAARWKSFGWPVDSTARRNPKLVHQYRAADPKWYTRPDWVAAYERGDPPPWRR